MDIQAEIATYCKKLKLSQALAERQHEPRISS